jgi:hypothetical protein
MRAERGADRRPRHRQDALATAIGIEAVQRHGRRVRFFSTVELVNALEQEKAGGQARARWPTGSCTSTW